MKKTDFGLLAALLAFGLVLAGCPNLSEGNGGNENNDEPQTAVYTSIDNEGNRYTLEITENTSRAARYAAQTGDKFVLTVELFSSGTYTMALTCSGTIDLAQSNGTEITLSLNVNGRPLDITISGTTMTVITGTIVLDNGGTMTAPDEVTPVVPDTPVTADVYVAGGYGAGIPCYWKNGVKTDLPLPVGEIRGWAEKIIVVGNDIYVVGDVDNGSRSIGCYWKNGTLSLLSNNDYVNDMAVSNGDIYITGQYLVRLENGYEYSYPCYWINGVKIDLPIPEGTSGGADAISIYGSSVCITGRYSSPNWNYSAICYWENGVRTDLISDLPPREGYNIYDIAVSDIGVFIVGTTSWS